jgi:hypothetical protein
MHQMVCRIYTWLPVSQVYQVRRTVRFARYVFIAGRGNAHISKPQRGSQRRSQTAIYHSRFAVVNGHTWRGERLDMPAQQYTLSYQNISEQQNPGRSRRP